LYYEKDIKTFQKKLVSKWLRDPAVLRSSRFKPQGWYEGGVKDRRDELKLLRELESDLKST
jgi:hypothetical protein